MKKKKILFLFMLLGSLCLFKFSQVNGEMPLNFAGGSFGNIREEVNINHTDYVAISTQTNLYLLKDDSIQAIYTLNAKAQYIEVISDNNNNGYDELLIITSATDKDNILLYDTKNQSLIFSYSPIMSAYDANLGYFDQEITVEDYLINDNHLVFVAGYCVFSLNLQTGKIEWKNEVNNNLWTIEKINDINKDNIDDYVVSLQPYDIITISGKDGKIIYQKTVSVAIINPRNDEIEMNIWSMKYDQDRNILYASGEDGYLYEINTSNGTIITKKNVAQLNNINFNENGVAVTRPEFKKLNIELVNDFTGDNKKDIIYYQTTRPYHYNLPDTNSTSPQAIKLIDGNNLNVVNSDIHLINEYYGLDYVKGYYDGQEVFYVLDDTSSLEKDFKIYSIKEHQFLNQTLTVTDVNTNSFLNNDYAILVLKNGEVLILTDSYLGFQKNDVIVKKIQLGDSQLMGKSDYILNDPYLLLINKSSISFSDSLQMINQKTNEIMWTYDLNDVYTTFGLQLEYSHDFTGDGINDIVYINERLGGPPVVFLIDGKTGEERCHFSIALPETDISYTGFDSYNDFIYKTGYAMSSVLNYGIYSDVNQDGINEYYVTTNKGELYILNFKTQQIESYYSPDPAIIYTNENHYSNIDFNNAYEINDQNGDSINDFISLVTNNQSYKMDLIEVSHDSVQQVALKDMDSTSINRINSNFGDMDGDGISEISYVTKIDGMYSFHIISSKTGTELTSIPCDISDVFYLSDVDSNGDSLKDVFRINNKMNSSCVMLYNVSYQSYNLVFTSETYSGNIIYNHAYDSLLGTYSGNISSNQPAICFYDGNQYMIALFTQSSSGNGQILRFYDLNQTLKKTVQLDPIDKQEVLGDIGSSMHGDDIYFYQQDNSYMSATTKISPFVYDYKTGSVVAKSTLNLIYHLDIINNQVIMKPMSDAINIIDFDNHLSIANVKDEQTIYNQFNLKFQGKMPGYLYIYVDNVLVGRTNENNYLLNLYNGDHTILVGQLVNDGMAITESVQVHVKNNNLYEIVILSFSAVLAVIAIVISYNKRNYPLPKGSEE